METYVATYVLPTYHVSFQSQMEKVVSWKSNTYRYAWTGSCHLSINYIRDVRAE